MIFSSTFLHLIVCLLYLESVSFLFFPVMAFALSIWAWISRVLQKSRWIVSIICVISFHFCIQVGMTGWTFCRDDIKLAKNLAQIWLIHYLSIYEPVYRSEFFICNIFYISKLYGMKYLNCLWILDVGPCWSDFSHPLWWTR